MCKLTIDISLEVNPKEVVMDYMQDNGKNN